MICINFNNKTMKTDSVLFFTDKEAFELVVEMFPDDYTKEIKECLSVMKGISHLKRIPVDATLKFCYNLAKCRAQKIYFLATRYALKNQEPCITF